jgi:endonuclease III
VNKATKSLFEKIQTPQDMINLGEENLKDYIKTIGLYHTKSKNIIKLSQILVKDFNGKIPQTLDALESLAGVGRKTANVVMNVAYGLDTFPVDTHVFRVCNRTGLASGKNPLIVEKILDQVVPHPFRSLAHHWLILHGRYTCRARNPMCEECSIAHLCDFQKNKNIS